MGVILGSCPVITASPQSHLLRNVASLPDSWGKHRPQTVEELMHVGWGACHLQGESATYRGLHGGSGRKRERVAVPEKIQWQICFMICRKRCWSGVNCHVLQPSSSKREQLLLWAGRSQGCVPLSPGLGPGTVWGLFCPPWAWVGSHPCSSSCHVHGVPCDCKKGKSQAGNQLSVLCPLPGAQ